MLLPPVDREGMRRKAGSAVECELRLRGGVPEALHRAQAPRALEGLVTVGHVVAAPVRAGLEIGDTVRPGHHQFSRNARLRKRREGSPLGPSPA